MPPIEPPPGHGARRALLPTGCQLDGYRIDALLGLGGMGEVYRACQLSLMRTVALKVLSPGLLKRDPAYGERFTAEAHAAGRFNNPYIVRVHDAGSAAAPPDLLRRGIDRLQYYSMEYVAGESLIAHLRRHRTCDAELVLAVMRGVAAALCYAEEVGIVHRDIKPDNIMLGRDGAVKLADLGLATAAPQDGAVGGDGLGGGEATSWVHGTPLYMSPQQAAGRPLDHRSDQYSLGVTLFIMLTGRAPFTGDTRSIMHAHVHLDPPDPGRLESGIPEPWRRLCLRLLAKRPEERFQRSAELLAAVRAAGRDCGLATGRLGRRRGRRIRLAAAAAAAAALGLGTLAAWSARGEGGAPPAPPAHPVAAPAPPPPPPASRDPAWPALLAAIADPRRRLDYLALGEAAAAWRARHPALAGDLAGAAVAIASLASRGEWALRAHVHAARPVVEGIEGGRLQPMRLLALGSATITWADPADGPARQAPRDAAAILWGPLLRRALAEQGLEEADAVAAAALWLWRDPERDAAIAVLRDAPLGRVLAALRAAE